jgi:putative transposase
LPEGDADYSGHWRAIKSRFTRYLRAAGVPLIRDHRGEYPLWQRRFWEHTIRDERDYRHHVDYIHYNSVKHGLVTQAADWPHSSLHYYARLGLLTENRAAGINENHGEYGELF